MSVTNEHTGPESEELRVASPEKKVSWKDSPLNDRVQKAVDLVVPPMPRWNDDWNTALVPVHLSGGEQSDQPLKSSIFAQFKGMKMLTITWICQVDKCHTYSTHDTLPRLEDDNDFKKAIKHLTEPQDKVWRYIMHRCNYGENPSAQTPCTKYPGVVDVWWQQVVLQPQNRSTLQLWSLAFFLTAETWSNCLINMTAESKHKK